VDASPTPPAERPAEGYDLALVLSGGGARGLAHIGVLQVIDELALPVDLVVGVSMGGIVAACYAAGFTTEQMADLARLLPVGDIFRPRPGRTHVVDGAGIRGAVARLFGDRRFSDLERELVIVSSSVTSGEHYVIRDGLLADALVASCSIPLIFPPVTIAGHHLLDGGLIDCMPITEARKLGARRIVAVDASTNARKVLCLPVVRHAARGVVSVLGRRERRRQPTALDAVRIFTQVLDRATQPLVRPPVEVLIRPAYGRRSMFAYHRWAEMIACGRAAGEAARPALAALATPPDPAAAPQRRACLPCSVDQAPPAALRQGRHRLGPRQVEAERSPAAGRLLDPDPAAVSLNQPSADGQPQP
jgi:NTE family protein